METKEFAKLFAEKLVLDYPQAKTVQDLMEIANAEGRFEDETEMLSVWGRVCRLLPQREVDYWNIYKTALANGEINAETFAELTANLKKGN